MVAVLKQEAKRAPLKAKPRKNLKVENLLEDIDDRFSKAFEYLGR